MSLTFVLPLADRPAWQKLLAAIPHYFREVNGDLAAPHSPRQDKLTSPVRFSIGNQPTDCSIRLLHQGQLPLEVECLSFLEDRGPKQPRQIHFHYEQQGLDEQPAWPEAINYITSVIWRYSTMGYTGRVTFLTNVWLSGPRRCLLILENGWGAEIGPDQHYPPVLHIDIPDGADYDEELISVCRELGLEELTIPEEATVL